MEWFWNSYCPSESDRASVFASPARADSGQLKGLPPTLIQTAECEVLRDEGEAFGRALDAAGVSVTTTRYAGMIHDYGLLNALADVTAVRTAIAQIGDELRRHLC